MNARAFNAQWKSLTRQVLVLRAMASLGQHVNSHDLYSHVVDLDRSFYGPTFYGVISALVRKNLIVRSQDRRFRTHSSYSLTIAGRNALRRLP